MLGHLLCENRTKAVEIPSFWFLVQIWGARKSKGGISGVNFGNLQINFELKTSGDYIWHINISYFANHIGLAISTEEKKPLSFSIPASDCLPDPTNGK